MKAEWKYIVGIPGIPDYRFMVSNTGEVMNVKTGTLLSKRLSNRGYIMISIRNKWFSMHRLVAIFFVPGKSVEKTDVDHKDTCKLNNYYTNLEWVTKSENIKRAYDKGVMKPMVGDDCPSSTIPSSEVDTICRMLLEYDGNTKKVLQYCIDNNIKASYQIIQQIKHKQSWVSISDMWFDKDRFKINHFTEEDVRKICESLVKNDGRIQKVVDELKEEIPVISYARVVSIKMKTSHVAISDEYFKSFIHNKSC